MNLRVGGYVEKSCLKATKMPGVMVTFNLWVGQAGRQAGSREAETESLSSTPPWSTAGTRQRKPVSKSRKKC